MTPTVNHNPSIQLPIIKNQSKQIDPIKEIFMSRTNSKLITQKVFSLYQSHFMGSQ